MAGNVLWKEPFCGRKRFVESNDCSRKRFVAENVLCRKHSVRKRSVRKCSVRKRSGMKRFVGAPLEQT